jgi:hypothetical protein
MSYSSYFWYSGVILGTDTIQYDTIAIEMLKLHSPGLLGAQTLPRRSAAESAHAISRSGGAASRIGTTHMAAASPQQHSSSQHKIA